MLVLTTSRKRIEIGYILVLRLLHCETGRLLDTLTRALQSSGVDLSKANISVQIDLGQNATVAAADTSVKVNSHDFVYITLFTIGRSCGLLQLGTVSGVVWNGEALMYIHSFS